MDKTFEGLFHHIYMPRIPIWNIVTKVNMILVEMKSADKDKIKNCELLGGLKN